MTQSIEQQAQTFLDLAEKAYPGPWTTDGEHIDAPDKHIVCFGHDYDDYGGMEIQDAAFIVAARNDAPVLIRELLEENALLLRSIARML